MDTPIGANPTRPRSGGPHPRPIPFRPRPHRQPKASAPAPLVRRESVPDKALNRRAARSASRPTSATSPKPNKSVEPLLRRRWKSSTAAPHRSRYKEASTDPRGASASRSAELEVDDPAVSDPVPPSECCLPCRATHAAGPSCPGAVRTRPVLAMHSRGDSTATSSTSDPRVSATTHRCMASRRRDVPRGTSHSTWPVHTRRPLRTTTTSLPDDSSS